jgi:hypothetical protein
MKNGTILGWLVKDEQHVTIQVAEGEHDVTSDISSTLKGGGGCKILG